MRTRFQTLIWKELHEQKWAVASVAAIALFFPLAMLPRDSDQVWFAAYATLVYYPLIGGLFFGMRAAAGERAHRTAAFVSALPAAPPLMGAVKLAAAMIAALVPVMALAPLGAVFVPPETILQGAAHARPEQTVASGSIWLALASSAVTLHLLLFVAVFGAGQRSEILAAVRGVLAIAVWGAAALCVVKYFPEVQPLQHVRWIGPPIELLIAVTEGPGVHRAKIPVWPTLASMAALSIIFISRYSLAIRPLPESKLRGLAVWSPARLSSPLAALVWKQAAETLPLSVAVLGSAGIFSLLWAWEFESLALLDFRRAFEVFSTVALIGGFVLALLIGVGTFAPDLEPRVNTFWRSRPISASAWFWSKYVIGACGMLLTLGLPALAAAWWVHGRNVPAEQTGAFIYMVVGCGLLWLLMFTTAAATACLVRHTLYASILAVGVLTIFVVATFWRASTTGEEPSAAYVLGMFSSAYLASTALGWWLAKRDIVAYQ